MIDVLAAFVVTFATPYLINPGYANLSSKVGFIFGGFTTIFLVWAIFFLPELKGRSLEEVDELFNARIWAWKYSSYETKGLAGRVRDHEGGALQESKLAMAEMPDVAEAEDARKVV